MDRLAGCVCFMYTTAFLGHSGLWSEGKLTGSSECYTPLFWGMDVWKCSLWLCWVPCIGAEEKPCCSVCICRHSTPSVPWLYIFVKAGNLERWQLVARASGSQRWDEEEEKENKAGRWKHGEKWGGLEMGNTWSHDLSFNPWPDVCTLAAQIGWLIWACLEPQQQK